MSSIDNSSDFDGGVVASGKRGVIQLSDGNFNLTSNKNLKSDPTTGTITATGLTTTGTVFAATISTSNLVADTVTNLTVIGDASITGYAIVDGTISTAGLTSSENITITGNGNYLTSSGVTASNIHATSNLYVDGPADITGTLSALSMTTPRLSVSDYVLITGDLSVSGGFVTVTSSTTESFALNVQNAGTGPAIVANQKGEQPVVNFQDDGDSVFFISGGEGSHPAAYVGIGTTTPNKKLDVIGDIRGINLTATSAINSSNVNTSNLYVSGPADITGTLSSANVNTSNLYVSGPADITGTLSSANVNTSNLYVSGPADITGTLSSSNVNTSNLYVSGPADITGTLSSANVNTSNLYVSGPADITGTLSAGTLSSSNVNTSNLYVSGPADITGTLSSANVNTSNLYVSGPADITGTLSSSNVNTSNLYVSGPADITGTLSSANVNTSNLYISGPADITGTLSSANVNTSNLYVSGPADITGTLSSANVNTSNLYVSGPADITGTLSSANVNTSNLYVSGPADITGTLSAGTLSSSNVNTSNLYVSGPADITGTLSSANVNTSNLYVSGPADITGTLSSANVNTSNLYVSGPADITGTLSSANVNTSNLYVSGPADITGTLSSSNVNTSNLYVSGPADITGTLSSSNLNTSNLYVSGPADITGTLSSSNVNTSNLYVSGPADITGTLSSSNVNTSNLYVSGPAQITGTLSASNIQTSNLTVTNLNTVTNDAFIGGTLSASNIQTSNLTVTNSHEVIGTLSASNIQTSNLTVTNLNTVTNDAFIGGTLSASNIRTSNLTVTNLNTVTNDASIGGIVIQGGGLTTTSSFLSGTSPGFTTDSFIYANAIVNSTQTGLTPAAIVFGTNSTYGGNQISLVTSGQNRLYIDNSGTVSASGSLKGVNLTSTGTLSTAGLTSSENIEIVGANKTLTSSNINTSNLVVSGPVDITGTLSTAGLQSSADASITGNGSSKISFIPQVSANSEDALQIYGNGGQLNSNLQYNGDATFRTITVSNIQGGSPLTIGASDGVTITSDVVLNNGSSFTVGTLVYETLTTTPGQTAILTADTISSSNINATANLYVDGPANITGTLTASLILGDGGALSNTAAQPNLQGVTNQGSVTTDVIDVGGLTTSGTITAGNVGIGTDSPDQKLHIKGGNLKIENSGDNSIDNKIIFAETGYNDAFFIGTDLAGSAANDQSFKIGYSASGDSGIVNSNVLMTVLGGGNVGIGTDSPSAPLDVVASSEGNYIARFKNSSTAADEDARVVIEAAAADGEPGLIFRSTDGANTHHWQIHGGSGIDTELSFVSGTGTDYNSGTVRAKVTNAGLSATALTGSGAAISSINASNISSGTINVATVSASSNLLIGSWISHIGDNSTFGFSGEDTISFRTGGTTTRAQINNSGLSATALTGSGAAISSINAYSISSGTINNDRLPSPITKATLSGSTLVQGATVSASTAFIGNGAAITALNATNIGSGTINNARLPGTINVATVSASSNLLIADWISHISDNSALGFSGPDVIQFKTNNGVRAQINNAGLSATGLTLASTLSMNGANSASSINWRNGNTFTNWYNKYTTIFGTLTLTSNYLKWSYNGSTIMSLYSTGSLSIASAFTSNSDYRIKENIQSIDDDYAMNVIRGLDPKSFNWKDKEKGKGTEYGFLAQEVKALYPEMVSTGPGTIPMDQTSYPAQITSDTAMEITVSDGSTWTSGDKIAVNDDTNYRHTLTIHEIQNSVLSLTAETIPSNIVDSNSETYIYGKEVDDLHAMKVSYLDPLMVSAIQKLEKTLSEHETKLENILQRLAALETN